MPSLHCEDCKSAIPWNAPGCAACGAIFREVRCAACKYVGPADRFPKQCCPRCSKDRLLTVSSVDDLAEDVGDEAFVEEGGNLADEIERGFDPSERKKPAPLPRIRAGQKDDGSTPPETTQSDPQPKKREADPRPMLKRRTWRKETDAESDEDAPIPNPANDKSPVPEPAEEPRVRSVKQEPVATTISRRSRWEISPKSQQILRWAAMGLPVLFVLVVVVFWFASSGRSHKPRRLGVATTEVDPGALESAAAQLLESAAEFYRQGRVEEATGALQEVLNRFPLAPAAAQAREWLDRIARGEPPFASTNAETARAAPTDQNQPPPAEKPPEKKRPSIGIPVAPPSSSAPPNDSPADNLIDGNAPRDPRAPPPGSSLAKSDAKPRPLPAGFEAVSAAGVHSSGWPIEIICLKDSSHMMLVPPGAFQMGNNEGDENSRPAHAVTLRAFYVDRFEITLGQYKQFLARRQLENNAYRPLSPAALAAAPSDKHPVVGVAWRDANAYSQWTGKSLPTEAQWEKAARGSEARRHPWGNTDPKWERPRAAKQIDRVGSFAWDVSVFGCFDMAGNAAEWCADWYDPRYYASTPADDPDGPKASLPPMQFPDPEKSLRGGSPNWFVTWRAPCGLNEEPLYVGLRCVLDVELAPIATPPAVTTAPQPSAIRQPAQQRVPPGGYKF